MKPVVVCGSKRYKSEIAQFCDELTSRGVLVFAPDFTLVANEDQKYHSEYVTAKLFKGLTLEHFDWIRKAEVCYVYNKDGYAGVSVTMEMAYAAALGKPIFSLEEATGDPCLDALIDRVIPTPKELTALL